MSELKQNYYGSLCTEMYEILHAETPQDELAFYLSYAENEEKILEPLCGSGRFLIPFMERGYHISGIDLSSEMLEKLKSKAPDAYTIQADIMEHEFKEKIDNVKLNIVYLWAAIILTDNQLPFLFSETINTVQKGRKKFNGNLIAL